MQLFYAPDINPPLYTLSEEESRHAVKVLRLAAGDGLHLTDGRGGLFTARIVKADPRGCVAEVTECIREYGRRSYSLTMAVAPTKNSDRYEWFLEKATEVGVDSVVPIICDNSERRCESHGRLFKSERTQRLMVSAMKQSLKAYLPGLEPVTPVRELIARPFDGVKLIAHCRDSRNADGEITGASLRAECNEVAQSGTPVAEALRAADRALVLIGPEGDFTAEEIDLALKNGFTPISLGESRLRTETAALTVVIAAYLKNNQEL